MPEIKAVDYNTLPENPGCYIYKNKDGSIIYIGKAKNLKKRVASYFTKKDHDDKTNQLIDEISTIDYIITTNEIEALLLENNLIKKHYPRYNIDLKDSRRYAYLYLNEDDIPYIEIARKRDKDGQYFGPFTSGRLRREIEKILTRNFRILTSKPSNLKKKSINKAEYKERLKQAVKILKGDVDSLIEELTSQMHDASSKTHFEHAMNLKNQIEALESLKEKQNMEMRRNYDADIVNFIKFDNKIYLLLFNVYKGILENKQEFELEEEDNFLEEFLIKYYLQNQVPKEIILPIEIDKSIINYIEKEKKTKINIILPKQGTKKSLLDLALKNVKISLFGEKQKVIELQKALNLHISPDIIECFDISHLRGKDTVASMVTFKSGKPNKNSYRRFKIMSTDNSDDYIAMREVIYRRYAKSLKETLPMPDLIVIDGGKGQLSSAMQILKELKLENIQIISLAKKLEEIYVPNQKEPISLPKNSPALHLLQAIRDEAHRFAISYNRLLRKKQVGK